MAGWVGSWVDGRVGLVGLKTARNRFFGDNPFPKAQQLAGPNPKNCSVYTVFAVSQGSVHSIHSF